MNKKIKKINFDEYVRPESDYGKAVAWMRQRKTYTKGELVNFLKSIKKGKSTRSAITAAEVLLSPRLKSDRNGCDPLGRGNYSNSWGHVAYNEKMKRRWVGGKREHQRFRFCIRTHILQSRKRSDVSSIASKKILSQTQVGGQIVQCRGRMSRSKTKTTSIIKA